MEEKSRKQSTNRKRVTKDRKRREDGAPNDEVGDYRLENLDDQPQRTLEELQRDSLWFKCTDEEIDNIKMGFIEKLNRYYYSGSWTGSILSWKNRNYNKNILRIVDMTRTLWVLAVSPYWLLPLVPIQIIWLLYHIRKNTSELLEAYKITEILSYEFNNKNK